jgi:protein-tyrosine phosphatase
MSYVDLHAHVLPGLDDGAATLDDTVAFARMLEAQGVRDIACTPHVKRRDFPGVRIDALAGLRAAAQDAVAAAGLDVRLHPGGELAHPDALALTPEDLARIAQGPPEAPWVLLECPFEGIAPGFLEAAHRLTGLGYGLLLAHPERTSGLLQRGGLQALLPLVAGGALLQVNVSSLLGDHGRRERQAARALVRAGLVFCLASDAHPGSRERLLPEGEARLLDLGMSAALAARLTRGNPGVLLHRGAAWAGAPARTLDAA